MLLHALIAIIALAIVALATPTTVQSIKDEISWVEKEISLSHDRIKLLKSIKGDLKKLSKVAKGGIAVDESAVTKITAKAGPGGSKPSSKVKTLPQGGGPGTGETFR